MSDGFESIDRIVGEDPNPIVKEEKMKCRKNCKWREFDHEHLRITRKSGEVEENLSFWVG